MLYKSIFSVILFLSSLSVFAQNGNYAIGARASAIGGAAVTIGDQWSLFNNVGGLAHQANTMAFASYRNKYGVPEFSTVAVGVLHPMLNGVAGLGFFRFGGDLYNEQRVNLGYGHEMGIVSLGLNVSYYQLSIEGAGTTQNIMIDFGGQARLNDQIVFGAHVSNLNQAKLSETTGERIPTIMKTGLSYRPSASLMLNVEAEKEVEKATIVKVGLEYKFLEKFSMRTGFHTQPFESTFGLGFNTDKIGIDYYFGNNPDLGDIHEFTVSYQFSN